MVQHTTFLLQLLNLVNGGRSVGLSKETAQCLVFPHHWAGSVPGTAQAPARAGWSTALWRRAWGGQQPPMWPGRHTECCSALGRAVSAGWGGDPAPPLSPGRVTLWSAVSSAGGPGTREARRARRRSTGGQQGRSGHWSISYQKWLRKLHLFSLEKIQLRGDLIHV